MSDNLPDLELSTARVLRAVLADDPTSLGQALFELEQAGVAGMVAVTFARAYIMEREKTSSRAEQLRDAEAQVLRLIHEE
jgi:hypothetical protein